MKTYTFYYKKANYTKWLQRNCESAVQLPFPQPINEDIALKFVNELNAKSDGMFYYFVK